MSAAVARPQNEITRNRVETAMAGMGITDLSDNLAWRARATVLVEIDRTRSFQRS